MLAPVEISIIPDAGVIFLVPQAILNLFVDNSNDIDEGVYKFIQFVEDGLEPFLNKINVDSIEDLSVNYRLMQDNIYEITALIDDSVDWDEVEARFESSTYSINRDMSQLFQQTNWVPELYKLEEFDNIIDILSLLINAGYSGIINLLMLPDDMFLHITNNTQRVDFVLSEFCNAVDLNNQVSLDVIYQAASLVDTIEIDSRGGRYRCLNIWGKKDFTRRQRARLKKVLRKLKGYIKENK